MVMHHDAAPVLVEVREAHAFDATRLDAWLADRLDGFGRGLRVRQFEGGQSNPTFLVESVARRIVLRKKPPGTLLPTAHQVEREYRILAALAGSGVPVPEVFALCEDESVIGTPFYVMAYVDGRVFTDPGLPGLGPPAGYLERQIRRWLRQYEAARTDDVEAMDALAQWLPAHLPPSPRTTLVHGDYRIGNLVFACDAARLEGVLDWELATLGDPFSDLACLCMGYHYESPVRPGLVTCAGGASGIPGESEFLEDYCRHAGIGEVPHWRFYLAFSFFRFAAILQGGLPPRARRQRLVARGAVATRSRARVRRDGVETPAMIRAPSIVAGLERTTRFLHGPRAPAVRAFGGGDSPDASGSGACFRAGMKRGPGGKVHSPVRIRSRNR